MLIVWQAQVSDGRMAMIDLCDKCGDKVDEDQNGLCDYCWCQLQGDNYHG
jgi:NMD protein affecting ribosome stability and mRNA decay